MNINKFTQNSLQAVQNCEKIAADNGNQELAQEHLLYALLTQDDSLILKLIEKMSIQGQLFINSVEQAIGKRPKVQGGQAYVGQDSTMSSSMQRMRRNRWETSMYLSSTCFLPC